MYGTMVVTSKPKAIEYQKTETDIPATHQHHQKRPLVQRMFLPNTGPASIAVYLPESKLSYCWDAGSCRFRYIWAGRVPSQPSGRRNGNMKLGGAVLYTEELLFPIRIGDKVTEMVKRDFKGYKLDKMGYPTFEYTVDGMFVREKITVKGNQLTRHFQITEVKEDLRFMFDSRQSDRFALKGGVKRSHFFDLDKKLARDFKAVVDLKVKK